MSRVAFAGARARACVALAILALPALAGANPAPDAIVYFNVRPAGPPEQYCVTDIRYCNDLDQSTEAAGLIEFQLFIDPQQDIHGAQPIWDFSTVLTWPESWTLTDFCHNAWWGAIEPLGPTSCYLGCVFDCWVPSSPGLFLAATFVFDVQGYGKLQTNGDCVLQLGCPPNEYAVQPSAHFGEAATGCEYTDERCMSWEPYCIPEFEEEQLLLTAPEGGSAHGELEFDVGGYHPHPCSFVANAEEPWATGYVELTGDPYDYNGVLSVDADAGALEAGVYESAVQVEYDGGWSGRIARCVTAVLTVEPASAIGEPDPAAVARGLRLTGASPSSGPFVFAYAIRQPTHVRCDVYDAAGREVAPLLDLAQDAGAHTVTWRATDAAGRRVRPGVYMVRLALDGSVQSSRVVVVR